MTILVFLRGFIVVVAECFYNLPELAVIFAAKICEYSPNSCRFMPQV